MLIFAVLVLWKYEVSQTFTEGIKKHSSVFLILSANWGDRPWARRESPIPLRLRLQLAAEAGS